METGFPASLRVRRLPNAYDAAAALCVFAAFTAIVHAARGTLAPLSPAGVSISLAPSHLPLYALRTTLRMAAGLAASLLFTFLYAPLAAKNRKAGQLLVPLLDILQSVPVLSFLTFTVVFFLDLFPGRLLGAEFAAVFAIFTAQAWNMTFSFYQSLTTLPPDLVEAAASLRLSRWQTFWRLEVPYAMPGLVWNTMMSMSGAWFFVVASETIPVGQGTIRLPGIGSYVATALDHRAIGAVAWAIAAMLVVILLYDQLLFRPLVAWSAKFKFEQTSSETGAEPWMLRLLRQTHALRQIAEALGGVWDRLSGLPLAGRGRRTSAQPRRRKFLDALWYLFVAAALAAGLARLVRFVAASLTWHDLALTLLLGCITCLRVVVLIAIASLIWVPVGVWLGLRPHWARRAQPVVQFLAAFPANLFFPPIVLMIVHWHLNADIWLTPLMILGTQWYILFNVIAGAGVFPGDLREAAANFQVGGWLWWRRVMLPGILPYFVTGAITASGGSWNAALVSEVAVWGKVQLSAHGLGAYLAAAASAGDMGRIVLGTAVMSGFVLAFNRLLWRPLYAFAQRRLVLG